MTYTYSEENLFRQALLVSPGERQEVDYKGSVLLRPSDEFALKLVKHIQGMANSGGGWIVIGYNDKSLEPDSNHTSEVALSYEPTILSEMVNSFIVRGQQIKLTVFQEKHPVTDQNHPIIEINGFQRNPYVCRSTKRASDTNTEILQEGKVYLRRPSAATSEVKTPQDWQELIDRCVQQRRDELLAEFQDLFRRMTSPEVSTPTDAIDDFDTWIDQVRSRVISGE